jgi:dTDP-4-dehydrorhamnose 3,5-epimerase-like enzyme
MSFFYQRNTIKSVKQVNIPTFFEDNGHLIVVESNKTFPFPIKRSFTVFAENGNIRGQHAHKKCTQLLTCLNGSVRVICNDGENILEFLLSNPSEGLLIPPEIWSEQIYELENSILMVTCDRVYESEDYIRDFNEYISFRETTS